MVEVRTPFYTKFGVGFSCDLWICSTLRNNDYYQAFDFYQNITPPSALAQVLPSLDCFSSSFISAWDSASKKAIIPLQIVLTSPVCFAIGIHVVYFACFSIGILTVYFACLLFTTCLSCSHFRRPLVILWRTRQPCTTTSKSGTYGTICPICTILALCFLYSVPHP